MPSRRANISPLLKKLHWLRIKDRISFKTLLYVYKSLNGLCPRYIDACVTVKRPCEGSVKTRTDHGLNLRYPEATNVPVTEPFQWLLPWNGTQSPFTSAVLLLLPYSSLILKLTFILNLFCSFLLYCFLRFVSFGKGALQMPYIIILFIIIIIINRPRRFLADKHKLA